MRRNFKFLLVLFICIISYFSSVFAKTLDCDVLLKRGSIGNNVSNLQKSLNKVNKCELSVDGIFGSKTYSCVVDYQKKNNLVDDGIVGINTCNSINSKLNENFTINSGDEYVVIVSKKVNIYSDIIRSNIVATKNRGKRFKIYDTVDNYFGRWYKVKINGIYGYINNNDISKNIVIVDLSDQKLTFYKDGELYLETSVVTGTGRKHDTPVGYYKLKLGNMSRDVTLRGSNDDGSKYASHVDYWMPFITDRGIGFHDASWRNSFGGNIYKSHGSHGCVNMPSNSAEVLFNGVTSDVDVIVKK